MDFASLSDCFSNLSIAGLQTQPAEIRSESRKTQHSLFSSAVSDAIKAESEIGGTRCALGS